MAEKEDKLEQGLLQALKAIDNQIAREMQREPSKTEQEGAQRWGPFSKRVEHIAGELLDALGDQQIQLDSLLVLAQALSQTLQIVVDDLGRDGLGAMRTAYCQHTLERIQRQAEQALFALRDERELN